MKAILRKVMQGVILTVKSYYMRYKEGRGFSDFFK
jgi:hypothetical protein